MRTFIFIFLFLLPSLLKGLISTQPTVVTETGKVEIIFNAALGNQGLKGYTGTVYAHTGVITNKSNNGNDWKYAPVWGVNDDKYKMSSLGNNLWKLTIAPGVRGWYGVASTEKIRKLAFVFRSSDSKKEGKGEGDADLFVPLNENEFIPSTPQSKPRPTGLADGINYINDQTVTLSLFAPGKEHVHLLGDFNNWKKDNDWQLYKDGNYWWYTLTGLEKDKILDPAWDKEIPSTIYPGLKPYPVQTVRDFTQEGSIKAVTAKLDYLKKLGVNAIELMPIQEFDGNDSWGYNPCFYKQRFYAKTIDRSNRVEL